MRAASTARVSAAIAGAAAVLGMGACAASSGASAYFRLRLASTADAKATANEAASVVRQRLSSLGDHSMVTVEADNRIQVTLADPTKKNLVLSAITGVGDLTIRRVDSVTQPPCPATSTASATVTVLPQFSGSTPVACYTVEPPGLDRSAIASAQAEPEGQGSAWSVLVKLTVAGSPQFDALAASAYGRQLAIVVDDKVLAAPTVNARRFNGALVVVGGGAGFTQSQALVLAATLSTPPLPAKVIGVDCNAAACNSGS